MGKGEKMRTDWRRERFLEWLCTIKQDRMPPSQGALAEELQCSHDMLRDWKKDPQFLADWEALYRRTIGSPERAGTVMQSLYETAIDRTDPRQVQAAKAYMDQIEGARPQKVDVTVTNGKAAKDLTDDELFAMLANRAEKELADRLEERDDVNG